MTFLIIVFIILVIVIYIDFTKNDVEPIKVNHQQDTIDYTHVTIVNQYEDIYRNEEFVNKDCKSLKDFIINDEINHFDLLKLADLNGTRLNISEGWYPLIIELIKELYTKGWNLKIGLIKSKYASLIFGTEPYNETFNDIIEKYEYRSEHICETCGMKGEIRSNDGWDYVACRKHYLEVRRRIIVDESGFEYDGDSFSWNDIVNASFEELDHLEGFRLLTLELEKTKSINILGYTFNQFSVQKYTIGFGNFLNHLHKYFPNLNPTYLKRFENPAFCEICGYKAVYADKCECCENNYLKTFPSEENTPENKHEHIKFHQINWAIDEGEIYEQIQNNYPKNPNHQILFTQADLDEYEDD